MERKAKLPSTGVPSSTGISSKAKAGQERLDWEDAKRIVLEREGGKPLGKNELKRAIREEQRLFSKAQRKTLVTAPPVFKPKQADSVESNVCIVFDCSYRVLMTTKELRSLSKQITQAYGCLRRGRDLQRPVARLFICGDADLELNDASGRWTNFEVVPQVYHERFASDSRPLWYLSSEAERELPPEFPASGAVLVLGGLVDRNRQKGRTATDAAQVPNVQLYKLPMDNIDKDLQRKVLPCNQVVDIIARKLYGESPSWSESILACLPERFIQKREELN